MFLPTVFFLPINLSPYPLLFLPINTPLSFLLTHRSSYSPTFLITYSLFLLAIHFNIFSRPIYFLPSPLPIFKYPLFLPDYPPISPLTYSLFLLPNPLFFLPVHTLPLTTTFKTHTRPASEGADIELLGLNSAGRLGASLSIAPECSPPRRHRTINHPLQIVFLDAGHTARRLRPASLRAADG